MMNLVQCHLTTMTVLSNTSQGSLCLARWWNIKHSFLLLGLQPSANGRRPWCATL